MIGMGLAGYKAILDFSGDELLQALLIGAIIAISCAELFAMVRKWTADSSPVVGGMVLAASAVAMVFTLGYVKVKERSPQAMHAEAATGGRRPQWPPFQGFARGTKPPRFASGFPWGSPVAMLSRRIMELADADHDGRLTRTEARQAVDDLLANGGGLRREMLTIQELEGALDRGFWPAPRRQVTEPARGPAAPAARWGEAHASSSSSSRSG